MLHVLPALLLLAKRKCPAGALSAKTIFRVGFFKVTLMYNYLYFFQYSTVCGTPSPLNILFKFNDILYSFDFSLFSSQWFCLLFFIYVIFSFLKNIFRPIFPRFFLTLSLPFCIFQRISCDFSKLFIYIYIFYTSFFLSVGWFWCCYIIEQGSHFKNKTCICKQ